MDELADAADAYRAARDHAGTAHARLRDIVRAERANGATVIDIAHRIGMDRETVYRYLRG